MFRKTVLFLQFLYHIHLKNRGRKFFNENYIGKSVKVDYFDPHSAAYHFVPHPIPLTDVAKDSSVAEDYTFLLICVGGSLKKYTSYIC